MGYGMAVWAQGNEVICGVDYVPLTELGYRSDMVDFDKAFGDISVDTPHIKPTGETGSPMDRYRCSSIPPVAFETIGLYGCHRTLRVALHFTARWLSHGFKGQDGCDGCCKSPCPSTDNIGIRLSVLSAKLQLALA